MNITTEEELQDYFHSVHSFIRNKCGLYGKAALQFFNFFFVLKVIEPHIISDKIKFQKCNRDDPDYIDCSYTNLNKFIDENAKIYHVKKIKEVIDKSPHKNTFFMNFSIGVFSSKQNTLSEFIKKLDLLTPDIMNKFHVYGRVYEYFLGHITGRNSGSRSGSQMEDLGQFFTSRDLVRYCIAKVDPKLKNEKVPFMGDFFCGSGGFITEYIRYLNANNKIDWNKNLCALFGYDTDTEIIKSARVDIMTLTEVFNNDDDTYNENFYNTNTFEEDFTRTRVDFNFTNPPYGNSGKTTEEDKIKLISSGRCIKNVAMYGANYRTEPPTGYKCTKTKRFLINGDNKETIAILHGMAILKKDGVYCGVLKEGCFFDKKFTDLRKYLSMFYEVEYVISVPQDDFLNTSTKTSILIFKNSGNPTKEIKFCELEILKDGNKITGFNEINPQTKNKINNFTSLTYQFIKLEDDYLKISYKQLEENQYSFNFKNYIKEELEVGKGFKIVKLGEICEILDGYAFKTEEFKENGIPLIQISNINNNKVNSLDNDKYIEYNDKYKKYIPIDGDIIIGMTGNIQDKIAIYDSQNKIKYLNQRVCRLTNFENEYIKIYLYYYWIHQNIGDYILYMADGSIQKNISKETLKNIKIPIPISIDTVKIYLDYLSPANQTLQTLQTLQTQKEASICGKIKLLTMMGEKGVDYDEYKLGDIIITKAGKFNTKNMTNTGEYPFYNASINNPIGTHNDYCFDGDRYLLFIKSGNVHANSIGRVLLVNNKIASVSDMIKIDVKNNINVDYLYYYLTLNKDQIKNYAHTSTGLGHIDMNDFKNMKIRILKPNLIIDYKLDDDFIFMDKLRNDIQNTLKMQEETTKKMMKLVLDSSKKKDIDVEQIIRETEEFLEDAKEFIKENTKVKVQIK